jgi:hypothetical protein
MERKQIKLRAWKGVQHEPMKQEMWSPGARRGSLVIEMSGKEAHALLVDDAGGVLAQLSMGADQVADLIASAARTWSERRATGSFTVVMNLKERGDVAPRPVPQPGPGPIGDDLLRAHLTMVHHQLLGVLELAEVFGHMEQVKIG